MSRVSLVNWLGALILVTACGGGSDLNFSTPPSGSGGGGTEAGAGGRSGTSGASGSGGVSTTGGASPTGGARATGGTTTDGGAGLPGTGGNPTTGGATNAGGSGAGSSVGGADASSNGGSAGDGGPSAGGTDGGSGGSPATGGAPGTGGSTSIVCRNDSDCSAFSVAACQRAVCNLANGTCAAIAANDGTACNDGNACTQNDACQSGACVAGNPVNCLPTDDCHDTGTCDPATGQCNFPSLQDGTSCNDGLVCTVFDVCTAGVCAGAQVVCNDGIACTVDACDETTGGCTTDPTSCPCTSDSECDNGNACDGAETCNRTTGKCQSAPPVDCSGLDSDCAVGTCDPATGRCAGLPKANGTACDDGNACTQSDSCDTGACVGTNPVVCQASDPCHAAGTCNTITGACTNPPLADGSTCDDQNPCTQTDTCNQGTCVGANPVVCNAADSCHVAGFCSPLTGACTSPAKADGAPCDDGNACTKVDSCSAGACVGASPVVCSASDACHVAGVCNTTTGQCTNPPAADGTSCSDANGCTQSDKCLAGVCKSGPSIVCSASDQCHVAGTCDPSTGQCSNPAKTDGAPCSDGNACTQSDTCQTGSCKSGSAVVCAAQDQCHTAGTCNAANGTCTNPTKQDGTACNDGNACTQNDSCQTGTCTGSNPVVCTAADQCHVAGTCNQVTGVCSNPAKQDGTSCNDGLFCTAGDACQSGTCKGASVTCNDGIACTIDKCTEAAGGCTVDKSACQCAVDADCDDKNACNGVETCDSGTLTCKNGKAVDCSAFSDACNTGTCTPATGACSATPKVDGTTCNDGNACTLSDSCQGGTCKGANPVVCTAQDQCHLAGSCSPSSGTCSNPAKQDGVACDDNNACTLTDQCQSGVCKGANPVACTALDQCHTAGTCNTSTGACSNPPKSNGSPCNDGNACTLTDTCQTGTCTGSSPVTCTPLDQCHAAGTCDAASGTCTNPPKQDGASCNDGDACTKTDSCLSGACTGGNPVVCAPKDQCHDAGSCSSTTGACSNPAKPDGISCDDGNYCTQSDTCQSGACTGSAPVVCTAQDQCHVVGTCAPGTGICSNPLKSDGSFCNDGNVCTPSDSCQSGVCGGANVCSVTIDPSILTLLPNDSFGFTAQVTGTSNTSVTWSIDEGMPQGGVVDSSGNYTAPAVLGTYHVTATSVADPTRFATATVTVTNTPVEVSICPQVTTLLMDDTMLYTAVVAGTSNQAVTWSVSGPTGGTITAGGLFTPSSTGPYTITATSQAEPAKQATATAHVTFSAMPNLGGTVKYTGLKTGPIRVIIRTFGGGGTFLLAPGKYRVRDVQVPFGPVQVFAYRDTLGVGTYVSGVDPSGTATVDWNGATITNADITLLDPTPPTLVAPSSAQVAVDSGVALVVPQRITDVNNDELVDHYRVYSGLDAGVGPSDNVMMSEYRSGGVGAVIMAPLVNGTPYWFSVSGVRNGVVGPAKVVGPFTVNPAAGGHTVSGSVDLTGVTATGPLYVVILPNNGFPHIARYVVGGGATSQSFSVAGVPDGVYQAIALVDQANDGEISTIDPGNFHTGVSPLVAVQGADVGGVSLAVSPSDSASNLTTLHDNDGTTESYGLRFRFAPNTRMVTKVALTSGIGFSYPMDLPPADNRGYAGQFRWEPPGGAAVPTIGAVYNFDVTYADGATCNVPLTVTTVLPGTPTALSPIGTGSATPTFTWTASSAAPPAFTNALSTSPVAGSSSPTWQILLPQSATSVAFDADGTASSLTLGSGDYQWSISEVDPAGNEGRYRATFTVP